MACLLFVLFLLTIHLPESVSSSSKGELLPINPTFLTGTKMELNCTLFNVTQDVDSRLLYFQMGEDRFPDKYVEILDTSTARLVVDNITRDYSGGHIYCYKNTSESYEDRLIDHQVLTVADRPVKPVITECIVFNWSNMTCYWEPKKQDTGLEVTTTLYWTLLGSANSYNKCKVSTPNSCTIAGIFGDTDIVHFHVQLHLITEMNNFGNIYKDSAWWNTTFLKQNVKPAKVKNLQNKDTLGPTSTNLTVEWGTPKRDKDILYSIVCKDTKTGEERVKNTTHNTTFFSDLHPYTSYEIRVTAIPIYDNKAIGYWSEPSIINVQTKEDVPSGVPGITAGSYEISDHVNVKLHQRHVLVRWTSIPENERNGRILDYELSFEDVTRQKMRQTERISGDQFSHNKTLDRDTTYSVTLRGRTSLGFNKKLAPASMYIGSQQEVPPMASEFSAIHHGNNLIHLNWSQVEDATGYTVFWCSGSPHDHKCKNDLKWLSVPSKNTSAKVQLSEPYTSYIFALSVEKKSSSGYEISSGMKWSNCLYSADKAPAPPIDFKVEGEKGAMTVVWNLPTCGKSGFIANFNIFYCLIEDDQCVKDSNRSETVPGSLKKKDIGDIEMGTYKVWMNSVSNNGQISKQTDPMKVEIGRTGLHHGWIVMIVIFAVIICIVSAVGFYTGCSFCKGKIEQCRKLDLITLPNTIVTQDTDSDGGPELNFSSKAENYPFLKHSTSGDADNRANDWSEKAAQRGHGYENDDRNPTSPIGKYENPQAVVDINVNNRYPKTSGSQCSFDDYAKLGTKLGSNTSIDMANDGTAMPLTTLSRHSQDSLALSDGRSRPQSQDLSSKLGDNSGVSMGSIMPNYTQVAMLSNTGPPPPLPARNEVPHRNVPSPLAKSVTDKTGRKTVNSNNGNNNLGSSKQELRGSADSMGVNTPHDSGSASTVGGYSVVAGRNVEPQPNNGATKTIPEDSDSGYTSNVLSEKEPQVDNLKNSKIDDTDNDINIKDDNLPQTKDLSNVSSNLGIPPITHGGYVDHVHCEEPIMIENRNKGSQPVGTNLPNPTDKEKEWIKNNIPSEIPKPQDTIAPLDGYVVESQIPEDTLPQDTSWSEPIGGYVVQSGLEDPSAIENLDAPAESTDKGKNPEVNNPAKETVPTPLSNSGYVDHSMASLPSEDFGPPSGGNRTNVGDKVGGATPDSGYTTNMDNPEAGVQPSNGYTANMDNPVAGIQPSSGYATNMDNPEAGFQPSNGYTTNMDDPESGIRPNAGGATNMGNPGAGTTPGSGYVACMDDVSDPINTPVEMKSLPQNDVKSADHGLEDAMAPSSSNNGYTTDMGESLEPKVDIVSDKLPSQTPSVMDNGYTANMEDESVPNIGSSNLNKATDSFNDIQHDSSRADDHHKAVTEDQSAALAGHVPFGREDVCGASDYIPVDAIPKLSMYQPATETC